MDAYKPNGYGLYNMAGNVWEWTSDWFSATFGAAPRDNPTGPARGAAKTIRGGSYLCHDSYCNRYRVAARTSNTPVISNRQPRLSLRAGCVSQTLHRVHSRYGKARRQCAWHCRTA